MKRFNHRTQVAIAIALCMVAGAAVAALALLMFDSRIAPLLPAALLGALAAMLALRRDQRPEAPLRS